MRFSTLLSLASLALAHSDKPGDEPMVKSSAVSGALGSYRFNYPKLPQSPTSYYEARWATPPYIQSLMLWYKAVAEDEHEFEHAIEENIVETYNTYGKLGITMEEVMAVYENGTKYAEVPKNASAILYAPVPFNETAYQAYYPTVKEYYRQVDMGTYYGAGLLAYFALVFLVGIFLNVSKHAFFGAYQKLKGHRFRKHVTLPALWGYKHCQPAGGWLGGFISMCTPTRAQSLVVSGYLVLSFVLLFTDYDLFDGNFYWEKKGDQLARYVADRTGIMSMTQIPLVFLLGGRNNLFMWLTGWSFDTFNIYHRYTSRVMVVLAIIHSIVYSWIVRARFSASATQFYWIMGTVATIAGSLILFQGFHFFRSRWYETFLVIHIFLAVVFVIGMWYHCKTLGWMQYLYATIAVWAFDRFMRIVRIIYSGSVVSGDFELVDRDQLIIKAEMNYSNWWKLYPGVHIYMYVLEGKFWESHPFTVYQSPFALENGKMTVLLKAKEGMTLTLANKLIKAGGSRRLNTFLEGPYGHKHPVGKYDSSIYVAGGIGITATYSYAVDVIQKSTAKNIIFTWIVRNDSCLNWFRTELETLLKDSRVEVNLYITGSSKYMVDSESDSNQEKSDGESGKFNPEMYSRLNIIQGRPEMKSEIGAYVERCPGTTAVVVCGPPVLNDDIRWALTQSTDCTKIDYFEEAFSW